VNTEEINPHLTAKIVVSYVRHHRLVPDQLADLITSVHRAIGQLGQPSEPEEVLAPAVSVHRSVHRDYVICLDCGYRGKTLTRHIATRHGLSGDECPAAVETTERSSPDGSCRFRAPLDLGEGAWARSQALGKSGPANDTCCIGPGRLRREPEGKTHTQAPPSVEVECRERDGSSTDARQQEAITRGRGCVAIWLAGERA
jgi:hypothetical protein